MTPIVCLPEVGIRDFGQAKISSLLRDAAEGIHAAAQSPHPEAIHRMRVAIRRLQQSIRLFRQYLRKKGVRSVRAELRSVMEPAGELRNLDIAVGLIRRAGGDAEAVGARRTAARTALQAALSAFAEGDLYGRWIKQLGIPGEKKLEV